MAKFAPNQHVRFVADIISANDQFVYAQKGETATVEEYSPNEVTWPYKVATDVHVFWCDEHEIEAVEV